MTGYRVIVIGGGFWGKKWIECLLSHPHLELAAVVARTEATLEGICGLYELSRSICYTDVTRALARADADIVVVVSPAQAHLTHIREALAAGMHVICEKPLADTWEAALAIAAEVRARPTRKFMVSQTRRFTGRVETMHRIIASGLMGKLDSITYDHRVDFARGGYRLTMGVPILEDMICHHLDALRYITGEEPQTVLVKCWNPPWSQFSGMASTALWSTMSGGVHVQYFGSWTSRGQLNSYDGTLKLMGSAGSLDLPDDQTILFYPYTGAEEAPNPMPRGIPLAPVENSEIRGVIEAFVKALRDGVEPPCGIDDNLRTFAWNHAAIESCRSGRVVEILGLLGQ